MNNGRSSEKEDALPSSTGLSGGGSLLDAADTICEFAARLYVQRRSRHVEASERQAESERRKAFLRDIAENLYKKFDSQVDSLCNDPQKVCLLSEKLETCTGGRTTQSKMGSSLSKLQRFFKRAHTLNDGSESACQFTNSAIGEHAKVRTTSGRVQCSSNGPSSIDDTNSSSGNTGSSAYSGETPRISSAAGVTMQGDVALCVTNACDLPRTKRLKFERAHAVLRREEVRQHILLEFYSPSTFTSAASAQRSPKYGLLCRHIETLRRTTQYEPPKDQPALLIKTDTGVVYLVTTDDSGALGAWHKAIERSRQEEPFQRSTRHSWRPLHEPSKSTRANQLLSTAQQTLPWRVAAGVHQGHLSLKEQRSLSADSVATRPSIHLLTDEASARQPLQPTRFGNARHSQSQSLSSSSSDCLRPDTSDGAQHNLAFDAGSCAPQEELVRQRSQEAPSTGRTDNTRPRARTALVAQPRSADLDLRKVAHRLERLVGSASACSDDREPTTHDSSADTGRPRARTQGPVCDDAQFECVNRYVKEEVTRFAWFHDALSRQEAGQLVTSAPPPHDAVSAQPCNGVWLVRRSESIGGQIVLTFAWNGKPKHVRMQLNADGTCRVQLRPDMVEYSHVADALEHFATVGLDLSRTFDQPKQTATSSEFERQFGDFAFGLPAASPKRIVLGRFVADVSRFSHADRVSFGVMSALGEAAADEVSADRTVITVVPAYIKKRLLSTAPNSPVVEEASNAHQPNATVTQEASTEPTSARRTDEDTPCNSNTPGASPYGSKGRALANSYLLS